MSGPSPRRRCSPAASRPGAATGRGVAGTRIKAITTSPDASPPAPPWRVEVVLLAEPMLCMASGRPLHHLALKLTPAGLGPFGRPILLDPAAVSGLIESALTVLEAGIDDITEEDEEW
jgi:hypothetical protein